MEAEEGKPMRVEDAFAAARVARARQACDTLPSCQMRPWPRSRSLHLAQAKPPAYAVSEIDVKDEDGYKKDFLPKAQANLKEFGGKYLAGGSNKAVTFSGSPPPNRVVLLQFADMNTLKAFEEKQQRNLADVGSKYAGFRVIGIEGVEQK